MTDTLNKRAARVYSAETWTKARELYLGGVSLEAVGKELGIPYPTVRYHAWVEDWGVRARGVKRDPRVEAARAKKLARKLKREESLMIVQTSLAKTENLEVLARECLKADSARVKVMMSRVVTGLLSRLEDPTIPPRSAAQALGSLAPIFRLLYCWGNEPDIQSMKLARKGGDDVPTAAVNLASINTPPQKLAEMAKAKAKRDDQWDPSATECNGWGWVPLLLCRSNHSPPSTVGQSPKRRLRTCR